MKARFLIKFHKVQNNLKRKQDPNAQLERVHIPKKKLLLKLKLLKKILKSILQKVKRAKTLEKLEFKTI